MKQVTRTIEHHKIFGATVTMIDGELITNPLEPIEASNQQMNTEKALKLIQKTYGKNSQYIILKIETDKITYGVDYDVFMELATVVKTEKSK